MPTGLHQLHLHQLLKLPSKSEMDDENKSENESENESDRRRLRWHHIHPLQMQVWVLRQTTRGQRQRSTEWANRDASAGIEPQSPLDLAHARACAFDG